MRKILSILGPTASGKKEIAKLLLDRFGEKIHFISCDSRKIYRYMDIGTAKPPQDMRKFYSLLDIKSPDEAFSAGEFAREVEKIIPEIEKNDKIPIIIGGTPLYYKALFEGLFEEPRKKTEIREKILRRLEEEGIERLYRELKVVDPQAASKIHPNDWIRITRALEVYYTLNIPLTEAQKKLKKPPKYKPLYVGIIMTRELLYQKINERTERMFKEGLVEETRQILDMGYSQRLPSLNTIGYREVIQYLNGDITLDEAKRLTAKKTRIYSRRQEYFFRSFDYVKWFDVSRGFNEVFDFLVSVIEKILHEGV